MPQFKSKVELNQIPVKGLVFENCTSATRPSNPVGGQVIYETDTGSYFVYNNVKSRWESAKAGLTYKGQVGTTEQPNLPTSGVEVGDLWLVAADGSYGPTGSEQHANKNDRFIAKTESSEGVNPTWDLIENVDKLVAEITVVDGTTEYTVENTLDTAEVVVNLFDENGNKFDADVKVDAANIKVSIDSSISTLDAGKKYKLVVIGD